VSPIFGNAKLITTETANILTKIPFIHIIIHSKLFFGSRIIKP
jgi:hypothetical protein